MQYKRHPFLAGMIISCFMLLPGLIHAQASLPDTLKLTIPEAEGIFLKKNLTLLANQYNVDISKALVQQAKVWDNPTLVTDQNIYDGKFFRHNNNYGQVYIQVQQLIRTAGKIKKQTQLAQDNVTGAEAQFTDVMRNLRYILSTDLNNLAQLQNIALIYTRETDAMQHLVTGMDALLKTGDISQKENMRIKALLFSLQTDYNANLRQQYDLQKELRTLLQLGDSTWIVADAGKPFSPELVNTLQLAALQDTALQNRPDLNLVRTQALFQQHNVGYQKALAVPDFTVGAEYDQRNSYVPNYYGLAVSVPLPLFNRNKGNINAAQLALRQSNVQVQQLQSQVGNEVTGAWQKLQNATSMLTADNNLLQSNYDQLMQNMRNSYRQRQVSLIEFIDFFDSYKDTRLRQWQLITDQRNAAAELNFITNQPIIQL